VRRKPSPAALEEDEGCLATPPALGVKTEEEELQVRRERVTAGATLAHATAAAAAHRAA
jgi:hypothetical protein